MNAKIRFSPIADVRTGILFGAFYPASICPDTRLFHYTRLNGFRGILASGHLWATEYHYLNDMDEFRFVEELVPEAVQELSLEAECEAYVSAVLVRKIQEQSDNRKIEDSFFVTCFSLNGDNLTLWAEFAGDDGVGVEFAWDDLNPEGDFFAALPGKVIYDREEQKKLIKRCFSMLLNGKRPGYKSYLQRAFQAGRVEELDAYLDSVALLIRYYSMYFKKNVYRAEEEYRIVFMLRDAKERVKYLYGNGRKRFYIEINICCENGTIPLKGICMNPMLHRKEQQKVFRDVLDENGYTKVPIRESDARLRF